MEVGGCYGEFLKCQVGKNGCVWYVCVDDL